MRKLSDSSALLTQECGTRGHASEEAVHDIIVLVQAEAGSWATCSVHESVR